MDKTAVKRGNIFQARWRGFEERYPGIAQFMVFFVLCNGVTVLQMLLMPMFKWLFGFTALVNVRFQILPIGNNPDGSTYYVFDYAAGNITLGGGGGLAYFLSVELTMGIAQVINFISQRRVTFKSTSNVWKAFFWYVFAYVLITVGAAALQGSYKMPLYTFFIGQMGSSTGTALADVMTMLINSAISFWVFFPIMKWIFKK